MAHGATARVRDKRGQLALHRAAAVGSVPMLELLLANRSPLNTSDVSGFTALHHGKSAVIVGICVYQTQMPRSHFRRSRRCGNGITQGWGGDGQKGRGWASGHRSGSGHKGGQQQKPPSPSLASTDMMQIRKFIVQSAEREGIEV